MVKLYTSTYAITGGQWLLLAIICISATLWYYPVSFCHTTVLSCFFLPHYGIILFLSATLWYYPVSFCHTMVLSCFFLPHYGIILFLSATLWYYPVSGPASHLYAIFFANNNKKGQSETHVRGIKRMIACSFSIMDDEVWSPCASKQS